MKHYKKGAKVALVGENYFPPSNDSHMTLRRGTALQKIMEAILHHKPSVLYICPTKGVNINMLPLIVMNRLKFRLIFPTKSFFTTLTSEEKCILDIACDKADKVIILSEKTSNPLSWADDWFKGSEKAVNNSDWALIAHDFENTTEGFTTMLQKFEGNSKPVLAVDFGEGEQYQ